MSKLQNYKCALCDLNQHWIQILCKIEGIAPPGIPFSQAQIKDRETIAKLLRGSGKNSEEGVIPLTNKVIKAVNAEIKTGGNEVTKEITNAADALFKYLADNSDHILLLNAFNEQVVDNDYAYVYGVKLLEKNGKKEPAYGKMIGVGIDVNIDVDVVEEVNVDIVDNVSDVNVNSVEVANNGREGSECNAIQPPYPPFPVFPNLKNGFSNSLSMLASNADPISLQAWVKNVLCYSGDMEKEQIDSILSRDKVIEEFLGPNGANVLKVTVTNPVPGTIVTVLDATGVNPEKVLEVPQWALDDGEWYVYVSNHWSESVQVEVVRPDDNGNNQFTVTIANQSECKSKKLMANCVKATLMPELEFFRPGITCPPDQTISTVWETDKDPCNKTDLISLPRPETDPDVAQVSVKFGDRDPVTYNGDEVVIEDVAIGEYTVVYTVTYTNKDSVPCGVHMCEQKIKVVNGVIPQFTAKSVNTIISIGAIVDDDGKNKIGAIVDVNSFTVYHDIDPCGRDLKVKLQKTTPGSKPVDKIVYYEDECGIHEIKIVLVDGAKIISSIIVEVDIQEVDIQ